MLVLKAHYVLLFIISPANKVCGGYIVIRMSVRSFVRSSVRPSPSLIRYSSKTAEQNFVKLSGIVHYMMPYLFMSYSPLSEMIAEKYFPQFDH